MVLTASEAELLKGNANLIELLPRSDDSTALHIKYKSYDVRRILRKTWGKNALESTAQDSSYLSSELFIRCLVSHYAISLSLMVNIIHTHIYKLPE